MTKDATGAGAVLGRQRSAEQPRDCSNYTDPWFAAMNRLVVFIRFIHFPSSTSLEMV
jgi:hypothetical protein